MCNQTDCIARLRASIEATERVLAELDTRLSPPHECEACEGHGEVVRLGAVVRQHNVVRCELCGGTGVIGIGAFGMESVPIEEPTL